MIMPRGWQRLSVLGRVAERSSACLVPLLLGLGFVGCPDAAFIWYSDEVPVAISAPIVVDVETGREFLVTRRPAAPADSPTHVEYDVRDAGQTSAPCGRIVLDFVPDATLKLLRISEAITFEPACTRDLRCALRFYLTDHRAAALVTEDTEFRPLDYYSGTAAIYTRGAVAHPLTDDGSIRAAFRLVDRSTDTGGIDLSMPVVALALRGAGEGWSFLATAADPFYGVQWRASTTADRTELVQETIYRGSVVPVSGESRQSVLHWTDAGADGIFTTFYHTVPELAPAPTWVRQVVMGYYDYSSDEGQGWYRDLQVLAERIPRTYRGRVACCLHGWYDWLGSYCYDQHTDQLRDSWKAFDNGHPGRSPIAMSKQEVHRKIDFAQALGFRVVLYLADCTNMTASKVEQSWCGDRWRSLLYTNKQGQQPAGWTGPCGGGLQLDISQPEVRRWFTDYLRVMLREYGDKVDGFVLDETNYFSAGALCQRAGQPPAYGDQAQMRFIYELALLVQQHRTRNPDLCLLEGSHYLYGLVTHGSFTDFEGIPLVVNYRNSSIQCCWEDPGIRNVHCFFRTEPNYVYPYGLDVGLSNGWGSDLGPSEMPAERLDEVIAHFLSRAQQGPPPVKISSIRRLEECLHDSAPAPP